MKRALIAGLLCAAAVPGCKLLIREVDRVLQEYRWGPYSGTVDTTLAKEDANDRGRRVLNGRAELKYDSGSLRSKGLYRNDLRVGRWETFFESGAPLWVGEFDDEGLRTGAWTTWHDGGAATSPGPVHWVASYAGDLEDGAWAAFETDGGIRQVGSYAAAARVGPWLEWDDAGQLVRHGVYVDGEPVGTWWVRAEDGWSRAEYDAPRGRTVARDLVGERLRRIGTLRGERPDGPWVSLHDSGAPRLIARFEAGRPVGDWICFDADGRPFARGRFGAGRRLEDWTTIDPATGIWSEPAPMLELAVLMPGEDDWSGDDLAASARLDELMARRVAELGAPLSEPEAIAPLPEVDVTAMAPTEDRSPVPPTQDIVSPWVSELFEGVVAMYREGVDAAPARVARAYGPAVSRRRAPQPDPASLGEPSAEWIGEPFPATEVQAADGTMVDLKTYLDGRPAMIVILVGFHGEVCWYCIAQYKALVESPKYIEELEKLDARALFVYPDIRQPRAIDAFREAYQRESRQTPSPLFPIVRDPGMQMCSALDITGGDLVSPTTVVLAPDGTVSWLYRGKSKDDRPAFDDVLAALRKVAR